MSDRARQFLPFDALTGFKQEIRKRERIIVNKKELAEDEAEILNLKLTSMRVGMMIKVIYFDKDHYIKKEGILSDIDFLYKTIKIVKTVINVDDIVNIEADELPNFFDN